MPRSRRQLWQCPECDRTFANEHQVHACGRHELEPHFQALPAATRVLFERLLELVETRCGPVTVIPEKTRIALHVRMSFAALVPRRGGLAGHLVLERPTASRHITKVTSISRRNHVHEFRVTSMADLDEEFVALLQAGYRVGEQRHLET